MNATVLLIHQHYRAVGTRMFVFGTLVSSLCTPTLENEPNISLLHLSISFPVLFAAVWGHVFLFIHPENETK